MEFLKHVQKSDKIIIALIVLIIFTGGYQVGRNFSLVDKDLKPTTNDSRLDTNFNLNPLSNVWSVINSEYVNLSSIEKDVISYGLAKGLVDSLDDAYSAFLTPEETQVFTRELDQELEGIGAEITQEEGVLKVVSPLKGSPAEKAGLKPGDIIVEIDGEDASVLNLFKAIEKIRGKRGSAVTLTIYREGADDTMEISIIRDVIEIESVTTEVLDNSIFYISINQFSDDTTKEFNAAVASALLNSPKGIILDVRYNGGGYLQTAVDILGEFLDKQSPAVIVETGADKFKETLKTNGKGRLAGIPLVVLINEGSASASEILAGALQDTNKAFLIGKNTFGKGSVQKIEQFRDGSSLRLTIAEWLTPNGTSINKTGVAPDLEVEITEKDVENKTDSQLEKAKSYLTGQLKI